MPHTYIYKKKKNPLYNDCEVVTLRIIFPGEILSQW